MSPLDFGTAGLYRVLIVEDQGMFRALLAEWVEKLPGFAPPVAAASAEEALPLVATVQPDVALVDFQLPGMDGLAFMRAARQVRPELRALVLSSLMDPLALTRVHESGVEGYMEKDSPPEQVKQALVAVAEGRSFYSEKFRTILARENARAQAVGKILSRREQEILGHVVAGRTSREISELIGLAARTVEYHRANIMGKLGAGNVAELLAITARQDAPPRANPAVK